MPPTAADGDGVAVIELELFRTFAAPLQVVWDAWTDPEQIAKWWGPRRCRTLRDSIELDLRPGGRIAMTMVDDSTGESWASSGTFLHVDPPSKLVWVDEKIVYGSGTATTTLTLTEDDDANTVLRIHVVAEHVAEEAKVGWASTFDRLAELVAGPRPAR
jgi:uncharacterized protein YndB with AHSA1/START domain